MIITLHVVWVDKGCNVEDQDYVENSVQMDWHPTFSAQTNRTFKQEAQMCFLCSLSFLVNWDGLIKICNVNRIVEVCYNI
jgi:hypothetical protein